MRPTVRRGIEGEDVEAAQSLLSHLGHDPGPVDGVFGGRTFQAVTSFQAAWQLAVDGVVGPRTWGALDAASTMADAPSADEGSVATLGAWPAGEPNTTWFARIQFNGPVAVETRQGSNQAKATWSAQSTHQKELSTSPMSTYSEASAI